MDKIKSAAQRAWNYIWHGVPVYYTEAHVTYSLPSEKLKGKKIVITGGSKGIGLSLAKRFVAEGAEVLITGRNHDVLVEVAERLNCKYLLLDVCDVNCFDEFLENVCRQLDGIDCLVNNAAVSYHETSFETVAVEGFDSQIATNIKGPFFLSQKIMQMWIKKNEKGHILFMSSETAMTVDDRPYGWTKAAINSLVKGLAYRGAPYGIRVNAIAPGVTATGMTGYDVYGNLYREQNLNKRVYLPDEIAEISTFLLSDVSNCISGEVLFCNNGNTINARWK